MAGLAQFLIGHELDGRYRLRTVLGEGGFGVVFRAEDLRRGRDVAVKVMVPPPGMTPPQVERLRQRFAHEAEIAARLPLHPNLVRVLDFGSTDELDFLVMELLRGESLRERLARPEPLTLRSAMHLLRDAARGVAVGHENGLVHRDLKPGNIFLEDVGGAEPMVRILDFGIAKMLDDEEAEETRMHLTLPGEWFGSRFYSSSEHLCRRAVTRASDVYSLGVVAFELLSRKRLFTPEDVTRREQGLAVPIPSLVARNADVPRDVEMIVRRALADDAAARFPDAGALATELHRALSRMRRHTDVAADATIAVPAEAADDATVLAVAGDADGATVLAEVQAPVRRSGWGRRRRDAAPTGLDAELERLRMRKLRKRAVQAAIVAVMATGAVAGGYGLAAMRAQTGGAAAITAPPPERSAADENAEGLSRFHAGQYRAALEAFARAMRKAPAQAEYANNHAYALLRAGRPDEAAAALADVVARHPEREVAYSNLAEAQLANGDTLDAIATMQSLLAMDPGPARRREAEILLDRLDAHATDLAEWEDVQDAPWPPVGTQPDPYGPGWQSEGYYPDATVESVVVTQDTVVMWEDVERERTGVIRRRRP